MTELFEVVTQWRLMLMVLVVFCIAPRTILRLILRTYPHGSARREELEAEYDFVKRIERPLWVAEQFEMALFSGVPQRIELWKLQKTYRLGVAATENMERFMARSDELRLATRTWGFDDLRTKKLFCQSRSDAIQFNRKLGSFLSRIEHLPVMDPEAYGTLAASLRRSSSTVQTLESPPWKQSNVLRIMSWAHRRVT